MCTVVAYKIETRIQWRPFYNLWLWTENIKVPSSVIGYSKYGAIIRLVHHKYVSDKDEG